MNLLRPAFDAACASLVGTPDELSSSQCTSLWRALVPANAQRKSGRQRWTAPALALREPLRRELNTVAKQRADKRFELQLVILPDKPPIDLGDLHRFYAARLADILLRLDAALRSNGHWCTPDDEDYAQPIQVIVANERAAGRPAGNTDWTQWEDPATVKKLIRIFAEGPRAQRGAHWSPYLPNGTRKRGAAAELKLLKLWRGAFHDAIHAPMQALALNPAAHLLVRFYASLKEPATQQNIEDAIRTQMAAHKSPLNPAFKTSIWLALDHGTRIDLASRFHAALLECQETALALGQRPLAAEFDPAAVPNPWELREAEQEFKPVPTQPAAKYEEPAVTHRPVFARSFDTQSITGSPLGDVLTRWEGDTPDDTQH
jgi:hypothetical protein